MILIKVALLNLSLLLILTRIVNFVYNYNEQHNEYINLKNPKLNAEVEEFGISFSNLIEINDELNPLLDNIRKSAFFRIFKVNFDSECNFWTQNKICSFSTCTICQCDDKEVPLPWKQDSIKDTVQKDKDDIFFQTLVSKYNYSSSEWLVENEIDNKNGIYVNLLNNPETWTGYQGLKIWEAIYRENCFAHSQYEMCLEEKLFYKIISGLHSNINLHLSYNYLKDDVNKTDHNNNLLEYTNNITLAQNRVYKHSDRLNNLFYLYSILIKSLKKAEKTISSFDFETGDPSLDKIASKNMTNFYNTFNTLKGMNEVQSKVSNNPYLKRFVSYERLDELKSRFRNITSILDCVGCQKCKLHGKLQVYGLGAMLKILVEPKNDIPLKRNELIAFINLASKVSRAIGYLTSYKKQIIQEKFYFKLLMFSMVIGGSLFIILLNIYYYKKGYFHKSIWKGSNKRMFRQLDILEKRHNKMEEKLENSCLITASEQSNNQSSNNKVTKEKKNN